MQIFSIIPQRLDIAAPNVVFAGLTITGNSVFGLNSSVFQPTTDSTTFFQVLDVDGGTPVLDINTTNKRIGINTATPTIDVDLQGILFINGGVDGGTTSPDSGAGFLATYDSDGKVGSTSGGSGVAFFTSFDFDATEYRDLWFNAADILFEARGAEDQIVMQSDGGGVLVKNLDIGTPRVALIIEQQDPGNWAIQAESSPTNGFGVYVASPVTNANAAIRIDNNSGEVFRITNAGDMGVGESAPETLTEWTSTAPYLTLHNSTHEDSDGGRELRLNFKGEQSGGEETTLARIEVGHDGTGDDEKGKVVISTNDGDDSDTPTDRILVGSDGIMRFTTNGGLAFGSCYGNHIGWSQANAAQNTWYNISDADMIDGQLNGVAHDGSGKLTVTYAGKYLVAYGCCFEDDTANDHVEVGIEVSGSGSADAAGQGHLENKFANEEEHLSSSTVLDLAASATLEIAIRTTDAGTPTISVQAINITATLIGGT